MMPFDDAVLLWLNRHAGVSPAFDQCVVAVAFNDALKGMPVLAMWWGLWMRGGDGSRPHLLRDLVALCLALAINRILASLLPFVPRPLQDEGLAFTAPIGMPQSAFGDLSSFPSDHAVLFGGLAWAISRRAPRISFVIWPWVLVIVLLPRLYLGLHRPTDLLAGALIGTTLIVICGRAAMLVGVASRCVAWIERHPGVGHGVLFFVTCLMATLFDPAVRLARLLANLVGS